MKKLFIAIAVCTSWLSLNAQSAEARSVSCSSWNDAYAECSTGVYDGTAYLSRQVSNSSCSEGSSWGYNPNSGMIWVDNGCRGEFEVSRGRRGGGRHDDGIGRGGRGNDGIGRGGRGGRGGRRGSYTMDCSSWNHQSTSCRVSGRARDVVLVQQHSNSSCTYGSSWDFDRRYIYVSRGCRGTFRVYR